MTGFPLPPLDAVLAAASVVRLPLRTRFRGVTEREVVLLAGPERWSEFSPFLEYDDTLASRWLAAAIEYGWTPDAALAAPVRTRIPVNAILPAIPAEQVAEVLDRTPGVRTVKVKVAEPGQSLTDDVARVAAARDWLGADGAIRIDANQGWTVNEAVRVIEALAEYGLEYVEQPVAAEDLGALRARLAGTGVRLAADEALRLSPDPDAAADGLAAIADVAILKVQPLGGITRASRLAERAGLPATVSSALESSVGLAMGAHLAAALPNLPFACGLGTGALLAEDVTDEPLLPDADGTIAVREVQPNPDRIQTLSADRARHDWWRARIERCYAVLSAS